MSSYLTETANISSRTKLSEALILKLLTFGPRDPRIGDRPSPWGRGGTGEAVRGFHAPQIKQPSGSRPEVQPQKAITALGTLNLDRLHSVSADSRNKDRAQPPHQNRANFLFFFFLKYVQKGSDYAKSQWKKFDFNKGYRRITYCTIQMRVPVSIHYGVCEC